ncbi:MAG: hypothetical protein LBC92_03050 [Rickettsiales bacterium]|jgi:hypothetical protein|nr:hypothetical protein [Rickettsiales bacterium]
MEINNDLERYEELLSSIENIGNITINSEVEDVRKYIFDYNTNNGLYSNPNSEIINTKGVGEFDSILPVVALRLNELVGKDAKDKGKNDELLKYYQGLKKSNPIVKRYVKTFGGLDVNKVKVYKDDLRNSICEKKLEEQNRANSSLLAESEAIEVADDEIKKGKSSKDYGFKLEVDSKGYIELDANPPSDDESSSLEQIRQNNKKKIRKRKPKNGKGKISKNEKILLKRAPSNEEAIELKSAPDDDNVELSESFEPIVKKSNIRIIARNPQVKPTIPLKITVGRRSRKTEHNGSIISSGEVSTNNEQVVERSSVLMGSDGRGLGIKASFSRAKGDLSSDEDSSSSEVDAYTLKVLNSFKEEQSKYVVMERDPSNDDK